MLVKTFQRLPRFFRRHKALRLLAWLGGPIQKVRVNDRFDAFIDLRDGFARLVAIEETFEADFFALAAVLLPAKDGMFLDVGANFGLMSLGLWQQTAQTIQARLYEPNPHLCEIIERSIRLNKADGLTLVHGAAMENAGEVFLQFDLSHTGAGFVGLNGMGLSVPALQLDEDLKGAGIDRVDLIKIDVEGNEGAVLKGLTHYLSERKVGAVYFEYCPAHIERSQCVHDPIAILHDLGYEVFLLDAKAIADSGGGTHEIRRSNSTLKLRQLTSSPQLKITDLLATPAGEAFQIENQG